MSRIFREQVASPSQGLKLGLDFGRYEEAANLLQSGTVIFDLRHSQTGEQLAYWEKKNIITRDAGIIAARLFRNSQDPTNGANNGLRMLVVGTGATGNLLSPDAPQSTQRKLNTEIARKAFVSAVFRNSSGVAVAIPTNIVDFTTTFGENEAVGALNEMGLVCPFSSNPAVLNPINNGPSSYDPTIDVTGKDMLVNYLTFGVISKPALSTLSITWRLTF